MPIEIMEILNILNKEGFAAYIVGGALRDYLMGKEPYDFDVATSAEPDEVEEIFKDYILNTVGKKFGTISIRYKGYDLEITTFRTEGHYEKNRKPKEVSYVESLEEDLKRRDFTINALAYNEKSGLIDFFSGREDLENKIVRAVGNPKERIEEDALRIIRAIRFAGSLNFKIERELYRSIVENRLLLKNISKERIAMEFNKILLSEIPSRSLKIMADSKVLDVLFPDLAKTVGYNQKTPYHIKTLFDHLLCVVDNVAPILTLRLAALFHDVAKPLTLSIDEEGIGHFYGHDLLGSEICENVLRDYNYSKATIKTVKLLIEDHMKVHENMTDKALRKQIRRVGRDNVLNLYDLLIADRFCTLEDRDVEFLKVRKNRIKELLEEKTSYDRFLNINGKDLIDLGFQEGKIIGEILNYLTEAVLENPSLNNKDTLLEIVKEKYRS
ncbi:CCA tRNA nucleotidyltransferase [Anaerosphaera multitolerans]|uniref:HD domain-containing protein n=1 Tax=Anaerosphaera multitolerans TaxID=2487351 RepID=A0A437S4J3_9FIRM|nr:HD domain-containing protein [Anaerosphaera multitolerans]RVU53914.1 HD domain-containing protein [Anaerosphaera multitolerans]